MAPSLAAVLGIGLVLGFRHAFEPDHLAAVSTLATRQGSIAGAVRLGLAWAFGHTASVGVVVVGIVAWNLHLPESLWPLADLLVGVLLIGLGGSVLVRYLRGRWHLHAHTHEPGAGGAGGAGGGPHLHLHSHERGASHVHSHSVADVRRSLGFGLLHGLAGSAAILLLLVAAAPTRASQLAYFLAFGIGTMGGMLTVSLSLASLVRRAARRGERLATWLHLGSATASVAVGLLLAMSKAGELLY